MLFLKPADVPAYVSYGAADLGIVGKDILLEQEPDVYEPLDLGFGFCRLVVAEPRELWERDDPAKWSWVRVATKYPRLTEQYFSERGIQVEIVRLDGSIELAPLVGLAERIVDLVQSGETLRANGLVEVAEIARSTARLIVNRASHEDRVRARSTPLIDEMRQRASARRAMKCDASTRARSASSGGGAARRAAALAVAPAEVHARGRRRSSPPCASAATPRCSSYTERFDRVRRWPRPALAIAAGGVRGGRARDRRGRRSAALALRGRAHRALSRGRAAEVLAHDRRARLASSARRCGRSIASASTCRAAAPPIPPRC